MELKWSQQPLKMHPKIDAKIYAKIDAKRHLKWRVGVRGGSLLLIHISIVLIIYQNLKIDFKTSQSHRSARPDLRRKRQPAAHLMPCISETVHRQQISKVRKAMRIKRKGCQKEAIGSKK